VVFASQEKKRCAETENKKMNGYPIAIMQAFKLKASPHKKHS